MDVRASRSLLVISTLVLVSWSACAQPPKPTRAADGGSSEGSSALSACTLPSVDTRGWQVVNAEIAPIELHMPPDVREFRYRHTDVIASPGATPDPTVPPAQEWRPPSRRRLPYVVGITRRKGPPERFLPDASVPERSECVDTIGGRSVVIVSYRMPLGSSLRSDRYAIDAVFREDSSWALVFWGSSVSPELQARLLAILRSIRFRDQQQR
jgi:hypothetical protein